MKSILCYFLLCLYSIKPVAFFHLKTPTVKSIENILLISTVCFSMLMVSCSKKENNDPVNNPTIPVLSTATVTGITQTTATSGGIITSDGGATITGRGACWSLSSAPTISDPHTSDGTGPGSFTSQLSGLIPDTPYFVRAWATNSAGTAYGNILSFTTLQVPPDTVTDIDGNVYHKITIGTQVWLVENLRTTHYRNGDPIPNVTDGDLWKTLTTGAYCIYDNFPVNAMTYGLFYNWFAVTDNRNICPAGWHVPSNAEWSTLSDFLGGKDVAGGKMKSTGTIEQGNGLWYNPNTGATNSSGFTALPAGYRINYGNYYSIGNVAYFWSSSDTTSANAWNYVLDANNEKLTRIYNFQTNGFSIRCCKN
jgi:uncharacterized protein (TIGR02145 family)